MKTIAAQISAVLLVLGGLVAATAATNQASAATCSSPYPDQQPCGPSSPGATVTVTVGASAGANASVGAAAHTATTCHVFAVKHGGMFSVTSTAGPVTGGILQIKLHRVHTPGTKKIKISVASYSHPITRRLKPGLWHGTMIYLPPAGSSFQYCGIVFVNLRVKGAKHHKSHGSVKLPTSVSAGLRGDAS